MFRVGTYTGINLVNFAICKKFLMVCYGFVSITYETVQKMGSISVAKAEQFRVRLIETKEKQVVYNAYL